MVDHNGNVSVGLRQHLGLAGDKGLFRAGHRGALRRKFITITIIRGVHTAIQRGRAGILNRQIAPAPDRQSIILCVTGSCLQRAAQRKTRAADRPGAYRRAAGHIQPAARLYGHGI